MTIEDVHEFEALMRKPAIANSAAAIDIVEAVVDEKREPTEFQSTVGLRARAGAAYAVAEARLGQALIDLRLLLGDDDFELMETAQARWQEYRRALEDCALREFKDGTHGPLALTLAGLSETERRAKEIENQVAERSAI
ncbi:lysozyme inhibitor LprI family protein [Sphingomonas sp. R-74633]|uniref:lysozyme inhibitor LprI family protein n=1 Tax=Sphingomonas sp. R-74633 TaxID=2751188 RepID=UPI0015D1CE9D|nr:lysozyme inhibitor LprI family protein [Sphingomonas sp. R-74633]